MKNDYNQILITDKLGVEYDSGFTLKNINLSLWSGQFLVLIGPNGSGKSTLLNCLSGGVKSYKGSIKFNYGEVINYNRKKLARNMALIRQNPIRPQKMSVLEYVLLGRYPWSGCLGFFAKSDYSIALDTLKLCDILHLADRELHELSGGEWQKTTLAQALCQLNGSVNPLLLLDEISSSLDPSQSIEIFQLLSSLPISVIAAIHDCNLAAIFATHIIALKNGNVQFYGKIQDVFTPQNLGPLYNMAFGVFPHPDLGVPQVYPRFYTSSSNIPSLNFSGG